MFDFFKVAVRPIRFWIINSLQQWDQRRTTPFCCPFFLQSFLSLQSGSNARSDRNFYLSIKSYSPMDNMLRIRRQAKTNCEAATIVNVWCSLYDKIDVWSTVKRLGLELDCMSNYLYVTEEAISCNTINGSTYDLTTQQENLKKLSRFSRCLIKEKFCWRNTLTMAFM